MNVEARIKELAQARQDVIELERQYAAVLDAIKVKKRIAARLEDALRLDALAYFQETGDRLSMHEKGVGIQRVTHENWNTMENFMAALIEAPEIFTIDSEQFDHFAAELVPVISNITTTVLTLNETALALLHRDGKADWAEPEDFETDVVYIKSKLGEYLLDAGA